ncbi:hypothetical protein TTHERM_00495980 (macronuclear) [Tetrahymena thermophila SB210]|uniref:Uncharacterized protein n=1 Tax=Tetrahymena thermophila (strain SB210) TaxID=312017 RepID=I7M4L8_TETTS|nr:hypothetical protein TTHERM_00495980 [Tetrahymena thermophila SB210]EAS07644.2 hypothetical protein TTHERM_00495980 [Tetrahymena thermophila SB210]|eukprot:XP_001027886.2 hypothetical protein TTHERM_00495980 [Tetrahymena thermophila SB210]
MQNSITANRARISIYNFQNEVNALLQQQEMLEEENNQLKQRLKTKNEELLLKITNSLPKSFTDNFLTGLKKQSLHLDMVGDIAMSSILNDQFETTCSKQAQSDILYLRSIIQIQKEKLKTAEAKIIELNDFVRQQDSLLTQTKELLKSKCAKIQLLEEQLQEEQNHLVCLPLQQQEIKQQQYQFKKFMETEEEEFDFALQIEESRRSLLERGFQGDLCTLSPSDINETKKENSNYMYRLQNQNNILYNKDSVNLSSRLSAERIPSQRILQNNKKILNQISQQQSACNSSRFKSDVNNDIRKSYDRNTGPTNINVYQVSPFNYNQVTKTETTPHKRQNSISNGRRRSRAERLQKSTSSMIIYTSNEYNTFNPLN